MYTWGYLKENILNKLNLTEAEANELNLLSRFHYYANEAMTQICSIKPRETFFTVNINEDDENIDIAIQMPDDFISFNDDVVEFKSEDDKIFYEVGDDFVEYHGYNEIICKAYGDYRIPYNARWIFFTGGMVPTTQLSMPADICDAIPSYVASQCLKIDDEVKAATYRNEFEMFLARIDDTSFRRQRTLRIGGDW